MEYGDFLKTLMLYKKASEQLSELHNIGFDFFEGKYELSNIFENMLLTTFNSHYQKEGVEWIEWFIYEADFGMKDFSQLPSYEKKDGKFVIVNDEGEVRWGARDENGEPICYSYESLYQHINQFKK